MWSWVLAVIGITGIFFVGQKNLKGWLFLLANECLWIAYALTSKQYGFILASVGYSLVYIKSLIFWKRNGSIPL